MECRSSPLSSIILMMKRVLLVSCILMKIFIVWDIVTVINLLVFLIYTDMYENYQLSEYHVTSRTICFKWEFTVFHKMVKYFVRIVYVSPQFVWFENSKPKLNDLDKCSLYASCVLYSFLLLAMIVKE